jgi:hypothetical protein
MRAFYEEHYKPYVVGELDYRNMTTVLDYLATEVITMYETNVKQRFVEYVERFVNVSWEKKALVAIIKKQRTTTARRRAATNALCAQLRRIKTDLLNHDSVKKAHPMYHAWIDEQRKHVLPQRQLKKDSVHYDIQCLPQDYLHPMLYMMKAVEARGASVKNTCPLRSEIISKHFRLDTTSLIKLCLTAEHGTQSEYLTKGNLVRHQAKVWGFFFKTEKKCFHMGDDAHAHTFDHQIETDGVSCSILLKRRDTRAKEPKHTEGGSERYIDEVDDYTPLRDKRVVAIDPNMSDLLYCVDGDTKDQTKFRYTQDTRRKETKAKKYRNYLQEQARRGVGGRAERVQPEDDGLRQVQGVHPKEERAQRAPRAVLQRVHLPQAQARGLHAAPDHRGAPAGTFQEAVRRTRRDHRHDRRRRTAQVQGTDQGEGLPRTLFRKAGYGVYPVDEFRKRVRWRVQDVQGVSRPYRSGSVLRHGLVKCATCSRLWNRDTNEDSRVRDSRRCAP